MKPFLIQDNYITFVSITTVYADTQIIKKLLNFIKTKRNPSYTGFKKGNFIEESHHLLFRKAVRSIT